MNDLIRDTQLERRLLGGIVETRRLKKKLSQTDLARAAGITQSMLSRIELGTTKTSAFVLYNLCTTLKLDVRRAFSRVRNAVDREKRLAQDP